MLVSGATSAGSSLGIDVVAVGLRQPVQVVAAPGEPERLYVVERAGRVRVVEPPRVLSQPFVDIRPRVRSEGLLGLFSIAFHPEYRTNGRLYALYTGGSGRVFVAELRARGGRARPHRIVLVARISPSAYAHAGGQLAFGPGGRLLASIGDGLDPEAAQDRASPLGKILRVDVDPPEVVALGLRNPWRFSFDRLTGDLFVGDVGQRDWEEIDVVRRGTQGVVNFGWGAERGGTPPFVRYAHPKKRCAAVIGGYVYRGKEIPAARGRYFYGDTCSGRVWSVRAGAVAPRPRVEPFTVSQLSSFGEDAAGELYLVGRGTGAVFRLVRR
ncbi:MAG TPA: PQQ-dependent sugar dehydrogenase [Gaiellaceae bacterium]|nr:PQQ-dependent sugar dehydrogenase [Gaiellaceae bacterium]